MFSLLLQLIFDAKTNLNKKTLKINICHLRLLFSSEKLNMFTDNHASDFLHAIYIYQNIPDHAKYESTLVQNMCHRTIGISMECLGKSERIIRRKLFMKPIA